MRPRSHLSSLDSSCRVRSAKIRCDFSPAVKSSVGSIRQPAVSSPMLLTGFSVSSPPGTLFLNGGCFKIDLLKAGRHFLNHE